MDEEGEQEREKEAVANKAVEVSKKEGSMWSCC